MKMTNIRKKMYIALLRYDTQQKRVFLEGDDTHESEINFNRVLNELADIAQASEDWPDYLKKAISHFSRNGYVQIAQ